MHGFDQQSDYPFSFPKTSTQDQLLHLFESCVFFYHPKIKETKSPPKKDQTQKVCWSRSLLAIQIDAAINPGNSGGPCFAAKSPSGSLLWCMGVAFQVLGREDAENIGYIIPSEAMRVHECLERCFEQGFFPCWKIQDLSMVPFLILVEIWRGVGYCICISCTAWALGISWFRLIFRKGPSSCSNADCLKLRWWSIS